jgi:hypothetical protein
MSQVNIASKQMDTPNQKGKRPNQITYLVLCLFVLVGIYGLYVQNFWLVGVVWFPVLASGVYKIFDRYL